MAKRKLTEKQLSKELGCWTPESALEGLGNGGAEYSSPMQIVGYLLSQRLELDERIIENLRHHYVNEKRKDFLGGAPEDKFKWIEFRYEYIMRYFTESRWLWDEASEKSKIKDSITEESFLSFVAAKYSLAKYMAIQEIINN